MGRASNKDLTAKQKLFCEKMIELNHNQTQAYLAAYPNSSYEVAKSTAYKLMKKEKVINYINQLEEEALRQAGITPARIANELARQAYAELDPENGMTYQVKQNAMKMLMSMYGLDKKVVEADIRTITVSLEDDE